MGHKICKRPGLYGTLDSKGPGFEGELFQWAYATPLPYRPPSLPPSSPLPLPTLPYPRACPEPMTLPTTDDSTTKLVVVRACLALPLTSPPAVTLYCSIKSYAPASVVT